MALGAPEHSLAESAIAALRACGAQRVDPVRFRFIEALAERSAGQPNAVQAVLAPKLARALADYQQRCSAAQALPAPSPAEATRPGPLAELLRLLAAVDVASPADAEAVAGSDAPAGLLPPLAELRSLRQDRSAWTRLRVDLQMAQSLAQVPGNPGPLNSQLLLMRALQRLQTLSPAYLQGFISHVETLQWLAESGSAAQGAKAPLPGQDAERKAARKRPVTKCRA